MGRRGGRVWVLDGRGVCAFTRGLMADRMKDDRVSALMERVDRCTLSERASAMGRLRAARRRLAEGQPADRMLGHIAERLAASEKLVEARRGLALSLEYPADLPVSAARDSITEAIAGHQVVVVCGATGSGKTTQLPKMCLELGRGLFGRIGHTQPRRLAARSVASRLAEELGSPPGQAVGHKVRFADQTAPVSRIKVMTDGILLAELASDRQLLEYDTLIVDEAHERSLNIDFLLGYLRGLLARRADLKLIVTSATIDPQRFADHFGGAPVIDVEGRTYPVEVRYRPLEEREEGSADLVSAIRDGVVELGREDRGDVLVFLPGERDIREAAESLGRDPSIDAEVLPLYARLPTAKQDLIFHPDGSRRRVILATNVAETSLTVPGIRHVIDSGLARISRYAARSKVQRLPIEPISRASADQRRGRCGRVAAGVCIRLYAEDDYAKRPPFTEPEIQRSNLASVILQMARLKLGDPGAFGFIDPPSGRMLRDGHETLHELGALDDRGRLTDVGRRLARLPVDPRVGRMILAASAEHCLREVLVIAAALSMQDPRVRPPDNQQAADEAHAQHFTPESDFLGYWNLWRFYRELKRRLSRNQLRRACAQNFLAYTRMREWEEVHRQLRDAAADERFHLNDRPAEHDAIHRALLTGLLSHVGRRDEGFEYTGAHGRRFAIFPGSGLFSSKPRWIVAAELVETTRLWAHTVAPIQPQWIESIAPHLVKRHYADAWWDAESARVMAHERTTLFGLTVTPKRAVHYGPIDPAGARELFIHHGLVEGEYASEGVFDTHNRKLIDQIESLEAKTRRSTYLVDPRVRYEFYDARIGSQVYSGATFEAWRKRAELEDAKLLFMSREDLLAAQPDADTASMFPDRMQVGGSALSLDYVAEPGHDADGVTVRVPLPLLGQVSPHRLDWLVPGLLEEKIAALLKSLPKAWRRQFVPVPDFARRLAPLLDPEADLPLVEAIVRCCRERVGIDVPADAFDLTKLPPHLSMHIVVTDESGEPVGRGRDLQTLRERFKDRLAQVVNRAASERWHRDGLVGWDCGELPREATSEFDGLSITGHVALVDQGQAAGVRVFDGAGRAAAEHRRGLRRLFSCAVERELAFIEHELGDMDRLAVLYAPLGSRGELVREVLDAAVDQALVGDDADVRSGAAFDRRLAERGSQLEPAARTVFSIAEQALVSHQRIAAELAAAPRGWAAAVNDIHEQLAQLMPADFLTRPAPYWRMQLPRYLKAIARRLEKLADGRIDRDRQVMNEIEPHSRRYLKWAAEHPPHTADEPVATYRWMVEEYRVSLFAQDLGTAVKVSGKRLAEQARRAGL